MSLPQTTQPTQPPNHLHMHGATGQGVGAHPDACVPLAGALHEVAGAFGRIEDALRSIDAEVAYATQVIEETTCLP